MVAERNVVRGQAVDLVQAGSSPVSYPNLSSCVRGRATLEQFRILMRADRLFEGRCGRHYGGPLTQAEVDVLLPEGRP